MLNNRNPTADLHRLSRDAIDVDVLRTVSGHPEISKLPLTDPTTAQGLVDAVSKAFSRGLSKPSTLYGMGAQAMFASMVASLGWVQLIKEEDVGEAFR